MGLDAKFTISRCAVVALLGGFLAGCAGPVVEEKPFWPAPPDPKRYQYEGVLRNEKSIKQENSALSAVAGTNAEAPKSAFSKPFDIVARNGRVVVSDTASRVLLMFDVPARELRQIGFRGDGKLTKPTGLGMDAKGRIYVADTTAQTVVVFDENGHFKKHIGDKNIFTRPTDVCVSADGKAIYVVDMGGIDSINHRIVGFDEDGQQTVTIGTRGGGKGQFNLPAQCEVSAKDNRLYVLDAGNFRVQVFDPDGGYVREWGKAGNEFGNLARPRGLALDKEGNVYVTDSAFANFQVFNSEGQLLMAVGAPLRDDKPGAFSLPAGIAVDEHDFVYVVDQRFNKVEIIRKLPEGGDARK